MRRRRRLRIAGGLAGAIFVLFLISFLGAPATAFAPPAAGGGSSYDTGAVHVSLPSAQPQIDLAQDANLSVSAQLSLVRIVELKPVAADASLGPTVVAAAFPTNVQSYNLTDSTTGALSWTLKADLVVYRTGGFLFPDRNLSGPVEPLVPFSATNLTVTVTSDGASDRVAVTAAVVGWPFAESSDLLALEWQFGVDDATGYAACGGTAPTAVTAFPCGANPFTTAPAAWDVADLGFEGLGTHGPISLLAWNQTAVTPTGSTPVIVGTATSTASQADLVLGAPAGGGSDLTFGLAYALAVPTVLPPLLVHGSLAPFVGGAVAAAGAGVVGIYLARRRGQRLLDEL